MKNTIESIDSQLVANPRTRARLGLTGAVAAGALALSLAFGGFAAAPALADETAGASGGTATAASVIDGDITLAERVAADVLPSIGSVYCYIESGYSSGISQGSCEVLSADGYIVTNYHVIEGATEIQVVLHGDAFDAEVVGSDPTSDIAVLKIEPGDATLTPIKIGDSSAVRVGQWVMTLGTPYGESESVSVGIVSGISRTATVSLDSSEAYYVGMIQSDAMINSGSSGGAMVNADGEFIGMTTLSGSYSGDWAGMSYAIPSNYVIDIANQIIETGTVVHPQLGVTVSGLLDAYYEGYYNMGNDSSVIGAYVAGVAEGSGAAEAGIQAGDIITHLNGNEIYSADDLIIQVRTHNIGDTVTLTVQRDGETLDIDVVLGSDEGTATVEDTSMSTGSDSYGFFGDQPGMEPGWGSGWGSGSDLGGYGPGMGSGMGPGGSGSGSGQSGWGAWDFFGGSQSQDEAA